MPTCFVIQPFDGGPFDKRYEDVFEPAISAVGLEAYRVDRDASVAIPIDDIEAGIRNAAVCLADISTDNPNVWFELGYAIARGKEVVMVCSNQRKIKFPFDVQHRAIIEYPTESPRDFTELERKITDRLRSIRKKSESIINAATVSPLAAVEGLSQHEIVTLVAIAENLDHPTEGVSTYVIRQDTERAGYTKVATMLALATLLQKKLITSGTDTDYNGDQFTVNNITDSGMQWLVTNQNQLVLKRQPPDIAPDTHVPF